MVGFPVGGRAAKCGHGAVESAVKVPGISGIKDVLQFTLAGKEGVHFFFVLVVFGQTELLVNFFVFSKCVYYVLYTLLNNFLYRFVIVEVRVLWQVANSVAG